MEDGGSREGHDEDPTEDAAQCYNLSWNGARHHITIAHGGHRDNCPPVRGGDAAEVMGTCELALSQVNQRGEEGNGYAEKKQEEAKLPGAASDCQSQGLQTERVSSQSHHIENSQRPQNPQHQAQLVQVAFTPSWPVMVLVWILLLHYQGDIVGKNGHGVDDVEWPSEEVQLAASLDEPQDELQGEPGHTHRLDDEHVVALGGALALRVRGRESDGGRRKREDERSRSLKDGIEGMERRREDKNPEVR